MIVYISSNEKLEFLKDEFSDMSYEVYDNNNIDEVVAYLKNSYHFTHVVIDFDYVVGNIQNALFKLRTMSTAKIIVIATGNIENPIIRELSKLPINIITTLDVPTIIAELKICLTDNTSTINDVDMHSNITATDTLTLQIQNTQVITIGIAGVMPRIGTTTVAIRCVMFLSSIGKKVCYINRPECSHLQIIEGVFADSITPLKDGIRLTNVDMFYKVPTGYDYIVFDCGDDISLLDGNDIKLVVAGSTPWELVALSKSTEQLAIYDKVGYVFSLTDIKEQVSLLDFMGDNWIRTIISDYCPNLFAPLSKLDSKNYSNLFKGFELH